MANTHGTRTIGYDGGGERGSLPTSLTVSEVGEFKAQYGADGSLVREELPGKLSAMTVRDAAGDAVSLKYVNTAADGSTSEWLKSTATVNGFDQVDSYQTAAATGLRRTNRYGYDGLGRLVSATDWSAMLTNGQPTGASCTRRYTFDVNSNRTGLVQAATAGATAGTCPATVAASASYGYDSADRLKADAAARGALRYDALGRTRVLPSVDTVEGGGDVALDYYVDDLVASMSQGGRRTAFELDAAARRVTRTDTDAAVPGERRTTSFYSGDDDNPDVVQEPDNSFTRNITSFGGLAVVQTLAGTNGKQTTLQLANLHGDIAATVPADATSAGDVRVTETTEYGVPWVKPAVGSTQARYGWLGTHQRDASTPGGLTLMGERLYSPTIGRFLSVDPVPGGNANAFVYPTDPLGSLDLDGRMRVAGGGGGGSMSGFPRIGMQRGGGSSSSTSAKKGGVEPNNLGKKADALVPGAPNQNKIKAPSGRMRKPDRLDESKSHLGEIKNTRNLYRSSQFDDYLAIAQSAPGGGSLTIWHRPGAHQSRNFASWAERNKAWVRLEPIDGL